MIHAYILKLAGKLIKVTKRKALKNTDKCYFSNKVIDLELIKDIE
jgi:hypothetical protein